MEGKVERSCNWAAKRRSSQAAVWRQALKAEVAAAKGLESAAALVDLVKAFEMVRLEIVWVRGIWLRLPALILRICWTFAFTRGLLLCGAVSDPVDTLSAVLVGGGVATDATLIVLIRPCDPLEHEIPSVDLCLFVDDITIRAVGGQAQAKEDLTDAADRCIQLLEGDMGLTISRGLGDGKVDGKAKTFTAASSKSLASKLALGMLRFGISVKDKGKMLCIDFSCGQKERRCQKERPEGDDCKGVCQTWQVCQVGQQGGSSCCQNRCHSCHYIWPRSLWHHRHQH